MCPVGSVLGCDNLEAEGTGTFRIHSKTSQAPAQHAAEPQGRGYQPPLGQLGSVTPVLPASSDCELRSLSNGMETGSGGAVLRAIV